MGTAWWSTRPRATCCAPKARRSTKAGWPQDMRIWTHRPCSSDAVVHAHTKIHIHARRRPAHLPHTYTRPLGTSDPHGTRHIRHAHAIQKSAPPPPPSHTHTDTHKGISARAHTDTHTHRHKGISMRTHTCKHVHHRVHDQARCMRWGTRVPRTQQRTRPRCRRRRSQGLEEGAVACAMHPPATAMVLPVPLVVVVFLQLLPRAPTQTQQRAMGLCRWPSAMPVRQR
jgi:hypothetical protein